MVNGNWLLVLVIGPLSVLGFIMCVWNKTFHRRLLGARQALHSIFSTETGSSYFIDVEV